MTLLEALARRDPLTATEAAEMTGATPTNCSFHLRSLAKYGFAEEAGDASGRGRPWRRTHVGFTVDSMRGDTETTYADQALAQMLWEAAASRHTFRSPTENPSTRRRQHFSSPAHFGT